MLHERDRFRMDDASMARRFMHAHPFGMLILVREGQAHTIHLPLILDDGDPTVLRGHIARSNPVSRQLAGDGEAVFRGPHAYVSPLWYQRPEAVPTWNYQVVHALGVIEPITDRDEVLADMDRLVRRFETGPEAAWRAVVTPAYVDRLLDHISPFRLRVEHLQAQFKLSQDKTDADRAGVVAALSASARDGDRSLARVMADWYGIAAHGTKLPD